VEQFLYLKTRGRKTGREREIEIWFTQHDGRFYVIAEYETSHWVQNLRADPRVQIRVGNEIVAAWARVLSSAADLETMKMAQELSRRKYGWGEGVVVELIPEAAIVS
jgi:deazaflavin-dependent oxidoreductase (nitroreductase family)